MLFGAVIFAIYLLIKFALTCVCRKQSNPLKSWLSSSEYSIRLFHLSLEMKIITWYDALLTRLAILPENVSVHRTSGERELYISRTLSDVKRSHNYTTHSMRMFEKRNFQTYLHTF